MSGIRRKGMSFALIALFAGVTLTIPAGAQVGEVVELVEGTAVLLDIHSNTGTSGGGNGGNAKVASSATNIFAPAVFVDYRRFGGEPTVTVTARSRPARRWATRSAQPRDGAVPAEGHRLSVGAAGRRLAALQPVLEVRRRRPELAALEAAGTSLT